MQQNIHDSKMDDKCVRLLRSLDPISSVYALKKKLWSFRLIKILSFFFFFLISDQETETSIDPVVELPSNLTQFLNETASLHNDSTTQQLQQIARRRRRGIGLRGGKLDWWYGNWCGPHQGGYTSYPKRACNRECHRSTRYVTHACRQCLPPKDGLDEACMEHDRYAIADRLLLVS